MAEHYHSYMHMCDSFFGLAGYLLCYEVQVFKLSRVLCMCVKCIEHVNRSVG